MFLRTLLFLVVMYFLVKIISRLFLPSDNTSKNQRKANFFYRNFQQFSQQQQQDQQNNNQSQNFEEIEEAEFEDITDEENSSSKMSD
ncbi:hypothetical protein LX73_1821 [Fodinibius salinus]|uniref:DUF4834 family protein n=1 Tax=Fodinibius salinus TaxID=860790 RepID=A0A5D3YMC3_9BACT|nr:hypothetical protein [Fodinibius salinus]TYP94096.1 hypothetical protein LX73_1821 [Fodinibius salinus]